MGAMLRSEGRGQVDALSCPWWDRWTSVSGHAARVRPRLDDLIRTSPAAPGTVSPFTV